MEPFDVVFVTTPARVRTPRFKAFFDQESARARLQGIGLVFCLKRREPKMGKDELGAAKMGWTPACSQEEFASAAEVLTQTQRRVCLNVEDELSDGDREILTALPGCGVLMSGTALTESSALEGLRWAGEREVRMIALETQSMLLSGASVLAGASLTGLIIGSSYLSEHSQMYDQLGLARYRSLMRALALKAEGMGVRPYTTSNYCTFELSGAGDKNPAFVQEQVDFLARYPRWGSLTRFYTHLEIARDARLATKESA